MWFSYAFLKEYISISINWIWPFKNAETDSSLAIFNTTGADPPLSNASYASFIQRNLMEITFTEKIILKNSL